MEKVLTISIAAYNMEPYIRKTMDSLVVPEILDKLEVFIIDDGGTDNTLKIAEEYEEKYPHTFHAIHKENEGYGSTVNASMRLATGKYFKLLDGDDWLDSKYLARYVNFLEGCEADLVLTGCRNAYATTSKHKKYLWENFKNLSYEKIISISDIDEFVYSIWNAAYKTSILKEHPFSLPLRELYTDRIFILYPLQYIKTISFQNYDLYYYQRGREGQSVSAMSKMRHIEDLISGFHIMIKIYEDGEFVSEKNKRFALERISDNYIGIIFALLLFPANRRTMEKIKKIDCKIKDSFPEIYRLSNKSLTLKMFRKFSYKLYWVRKLKSVKS